IYNPNVSVFHGYRRESYKSLKFLRIHINSIIKYFNKWGWFTDNGRKETNERCIRLYKEGK
ncbi:MAG: glycosyltransferase family 2 protein, partial [Muribaculaceae bacterium]|nr:glycosyltransferase family 2 protein [Muribaculaceae bacterium]